MLRTRSLLLLAALTVWATSPAAAQSFIRTGGEPAPSAAASMAGFGGALVVVDGDVIVGEGRNSLRSGMVYVYRSDGDGGWREVQALAADGAEPGDGFGRAMSRYGGDLLVTAPDQDGGAGAAYLFTRSTAGVWQEAGRLPAVPGAEEGGGFGASAALDGEWAFVGAPGENDFEGAVHVFRRGAASTWNYEGRLDAADGTAGDQFAASLVAGNGLLLVGAPGRAERTGTVHAFRLDQASGQWRASGQVTASGLERNNGFGASLALDGERVVVGAPQYGGGYGAAFLFRPDLSGSWLEDGRLTAVAGTRQDGFGSAVSTAGDQIWVGAPRAAGHGVAFVFERDTPEEGWTRARRVAAAEAAPQALFGSTLAVEGDVAAVGLAGADHRAGAVAIFERDDEGAWREATTLLSEPEALPRIVGEELECGPDGRVADLFPCHEVELLGFLPIPELGGGRGVRLNDIWGWTDPETGREYALVGRIEGSAFVDISNPSQPVYVGQLLKTEGSPAASWRDIKVYENHAYVVADASGEHGMQVFDLTRLREFNGEPITWEPDTTYHEIHSAHNVVINEDTGFAYAVGSSMGGQTCGGGLHMIDIRQPKNPTFAGCFSDTQTGRASTGYSHDAQCVVYQGPHEEYQGREICLGANETALSIADVTDKDAPVALSRASYPNVGYSHQGWLTEDHRYFYMNDELDELSGLVDRTRTIIWDVTRLDDPQVVSEFMGTTGASDHNLYIRGDLMYQSNYAAGLRILDISDPLSPVEVGYLDTAPFDDPEPGFSGSWSNYPFFESGTIAVSSIGEGLFLVRFTPPGRPVL